jgi:hypothetical protein
MATAPHAILGITLVSFARIGDIGMGTDGRIDGDQGSLGGTSRFSSYQAANDTGADHR